MSRRRAIIKDKSEQIAAESVFIINELPTIDQDECPTCGRRLKKGRPRRKHDDTGNDAGSDQ